MDIRKLLSPDRIAIIGASEREGFGGDTCRNVMEYMDENRYFFINRKGGTAFGKPCYTSISDLPKPVDLVVICTPRDTVEPLLREAAAKGVGAAVVYASGYSEVGTDEGRLAEQRLIDVCHELDMALMGPNCAGYVNFAKAVSPFAFISEERDRRGSVGVVSQSGQLALSMMDSPKMKFSYAISAGNSSVCRIEDYLEFLVEDPDTRVVAAYIEGVREPKQFVRVLRRAVELHKPIVMLKTGRSQKGQALAASHTGSLAGADRVYDALFQKFGVIRVDDLEELLSTSVALSTLKTLPQGTGFASMNLSGGETGICADLGEQYGIQFPDFTDETLERLRGMLPSYSTPNNPLDMTASLSYDVEKYAAALETVMSDPGVSLVAVGYTLLQEIADPAIRYMALAIEKVCSRADAKPVVMIPFAENTRNVEYSDILERIGVPVLPAPQYAFKILKNISDYVSYNMENCNLDVAVPGKSEKKKLGVALSESESKNRLAAYAIPFPEGLVASTEDEAAAAIHALGFPVVAKIDSPDILHKSDVGCVRLKLDTEEKVRSAYREIMDNAKIHCPGARIDGVQINAMAKPGTEIILGVVSDPQFGPCILCGLGGVFVEVFNDTAMRLAPVSQAEALEMVSGLKGFKLLNGYRGGAALDVEALVQTIVRVSNFAADHVDSLMELDINPIFLYEEGLCAVDALIVECG